MTWRYIIKQLGFPPSGLILLFLLSWMLRKHLPRLASFIFLLTLTAFYVLSIPLSVEHFARYIETEAALTAEQLEQLDQHADVIVVLGGGRELADDAWGSDQPSLFAQQRLRYASRLAKTSELPILISGGLHFGQPPSEAQIGSETLAIDFNLETHWLEGESRTTWENAQFSAKTLQPLGIKKIVLVTDAWHMPRARWSFEQHGFEVISAPMGFFSVPRQRPAFGLLPESKAFWQNSLLLNEWVGQKLYLHEYLKNN